MQLDIFRSDFVIHGIQLEKKNKKELLKKTYGRVILQMLIQIV